MFACLSVLFIALNTGRERRRRAASWEDVVGDGCAHYLDSQEVLRLHFNYTTSRRGLSASLVFLLSLGSVVNIPIFPLLKNPKPFPLYGNLKDCFYLLSWLHFCSAQWIIHVGSTFDSKAFIVDLTFLCGLCGEKSLIFKEICHSQCHVQRSGCLCLGDFVHTDIL